MIMIAAAASLVIGLLPALKNCRKQTIRHPSFLLNLSEAESNVEPSPRVVVRKLRFPPGVGMHEMRYFTKFNLA
jgi:hypothetical protein